MEGLLGDYGYKVFTEESRSEEADIWVVNTCTVKNPSQNAMSRILKKGKELRKGLVVAGCVPQGDRHLKELDEMSLIGVNQIDRIVEVVEETAKGNHLRLLSKKELPRLDLPKVQHSRHILLICYTTMVPYNIAGLWADSEKPTCRNHPSINWLPGILYILQNKTRKGYARKLFPGGNSFPSRAHNSTRLERKRHRKV